VAGQGDGPIVHAGVAYTAWQHHHAGLVYWLVYGPRTMSSPPVGGSPSGLSIAADEFQHLRPA
jgi:hypothetical protein